MEDINKLSDLVWIDSPEAIFEEAGTILKMISFDLENGPVSSAFNMIADLYRGDFPGYRACNTEYHDLQHTLDTFLAMVRLIHGAVIKGRTFSERDISLGLICSLLHDAGYIQIKQDRSGTGAKYTVKHVQRSMDFLKSYGADLGLTEDEIRAGRIMILCTDLAVNLAEADFPSKDIEVLGKMLGAADLLAQMSDRIYLEKLLFLYREFKEAKVGGYESEIDLLNKTVAFFDLMAKRFETQLDGVDQFVGAHFDARWKVKRNLYLEAILNQKKYLQQVLKIPNADPLTYLNRNGIAEKIRRETRVQKS